MPGIFDYLSSVFKSPPVDTNSDNNPNDLQAQGAIDRQQVLIDSILGGVPTGFPASKYQALAQAYLKNYADQSNSMGSDDGHADATDYRRGHVGQALEWARKQAGLVPYGIYNPKTRSYDPAQ
jgi:hypothetical protein